MGQQPLPYTVCRHLPFVQMTVVTRLVPEWLILGGTHGSLTDNILQERSRIRQAAGVGELNRGILAAQSVLCLEVGGYVCESSRSAH